MNITIGIDPGKTGAIAVLYGPTPLVLDLPATPQGLADCFGLPGAHWHTLAMAYVEQVGSRPGDGRAGLFTFGKGAGTIEGVLAALRIPYRLVPPHVWKRKLGLLKQDKDASRARAMQLFPTLSPRLSRKRDDGRAEALLLAHYGRLEAGGLPSSVPVEGP
jgi:crossover junction endodeoxyribonuclease RuvC